jgi:protoporphyrinogen oxidase
MLDLTILGGGPAGVGVAFYAQRAGVPFTLFEKSAELGGMCRTLRHGEHLYDCGAHRFHDQDGEITRDVLELMGDEMLAVDAPSKVWDRGRFVDFPPTPLNAILSRSPLEVWRIGVEMLRAHLQPRECVSFEDFAISQFGETLARRIALNYCHPPLEGDHVALVVLRTDFPSQKDLAYRRRLSLSAPGLRADSAESREHAAARIDSPRA